MITERYDYTPIKRKQIDGKRTGIFGSGVLDWHANLNGPTRADGVALQGWSHCEGTSTTWLNTTKVLNTVSMHSRAESKIPVTLALSTMRLAHQKARFPTRPIVFPSSVHHSVFICIF